jgi:hypothetical protein
VLLLEVKASLKHGEFMSWVQENCRFSQATANNYMKASQNPNALGNSIRHLFPSGAPQGQRNAFTGEVEWYTPAEYIEAARKLMGGIDLDPATSEAAQKTVRAKQYFTENGIQQEWGGRVWLNPPYGPAIGEFVTRLVECVASGAVTEAVLLTHNSCDTSWWHEAHGACAAFMHTRGRINFTRSDGFTASPPLGQTFFYFGKRPKSFATKFAEFGCVSIPYA